MEISPKTSAVPVVRAVSQATRPSGSLSRTASRTASLIWSAILSGWPSVTDSEVNRRRRVRLMAAPPIPPAATADAQCAGPAPVRDRRDRTSAPLATIDRRSTAGGESARDRVLLAARITYDRAPKRPGGGPWRVPVDQTLRCRECGVDFIWTEGEQEFFASRGLTNPPSRCPSCRAARRAARAVAAAAAAVAAAEAAARRRALQRSAPDVRGDLCRLRRHRARPLPASRRQARLLQRLLPAVGPLSDAAPEGAIAIGSRVTFPYGGSRRTGTVSDVSVMPDASGGAHRLVPDRRRHPQGLRPGRRHPAGQQCPGGGVRRRRRGRRLRPQAAAQSPTSLRLATVATM